MKKKYWHITDFEEIYKLSDDKRSGKKGPLAYTKSFVSLCGISKPCDVRLYERLKYLKSRPERHLLRSVYEDLKNWSADKLQIYQGYLVTHAGRPADYNYIAAQLDHIDKDELKKAMQILSRIGLIELVSINGEFQEKNEDCPDGSGTGPDDSGNVPPDSGTDSPPLKKAEGKGGTASPKGKGKRQATSNKTAVAGSKEKKTASAQTTGNALEQDLTGCPQDQVPKAEVPTESDAQGGENAPVGSNSPPGSALSQQSGDYGPDWPSGNYTHADCKYTERIYKELGYDGDLSGDKAIREITSMASVWHDCIKKLSKLPAEQIIRFEWLGIRTAQRLFRKIRSGRGKKIEKPPAMWNDLIRDSAYRILIRAGPDAV